MQYVGKVGDYVYNQWNSLNPATLSGAIDIIVIEQPDGSLHCLPWHIRFGKFQIIKPLQKKIDLYVNDIHTDLPMKLGDGGEAFFVFETDSSDFSLLVVTSPVVSAESSPLASPVELPSELPLDLAKNEPEELDLNASSVADMERKVRLQSSPPPAALADRSDTPTLVLRLAFEKAKKITQELNIPSKIDVNGDMVLDMDGYKPNSQKNIDVSDKLVHKIFLKEMNNLIGGKEFPVGPENDDDEETEFDLLQSIIIKDKDGNIRIVNKDPEYGPTDPDLIDAAKLTFPSNESLVTDEVPVTTSASLSKTYIKTLRLTSEQLLSMKLQYGRNKLRFKLRQGTSQIESDLYLWKSTTPIVISDIDGTITKSDALGHVLNMLGKDWTHPGVANLFQDISRNGYNILYLTARSVGQADTTRQYLDSITQDGGMKLPKGPVILSPDRTMAALRREIILKKPEVFKMACLRDIKSLFFSKRGELTKDDLEDDRTPFYAGFGNRITDAISYRSVKIPSHRIFTINPNGEVHMELLELAGYKSSYLHIGELVDQFFPPLKYISAFNNYWDQDQLDQYMHSKDMDDAKDDSAPSPGSPRSPASPGSPRSIHSGEIILRADEKFTDLNFWREPLINLSDLSDLEDDEKPLKSTPSSPILSVSSLTGSPKLTHLPGEESKLQKSPAKDRPISASFTSPLKSFMLRGNATAPEPKPLKSPMEISSQPAHADDDDDDDYTDDYDDDDDDEDDDYTNDEDGIDDFDDDEDDEDDIDYEDEQDEDVEFDEKDEEDEGDESGDLAESRGEGHKMREAARGDPEIVTASSMLAKVGLQ